jgi:hypothetical protein
VQAQQPKPITKQRLSVGERVVLFVDSAFCLLSIGITVGRPDTASLIFIAYFGTMILCLLAKQRKLARWLHGILALGLLGLTLVCGVIVFNGMVLGRGDGDLVAVAYQITPMVLGLCVLFTTLTWLLKHSDDDK